MDNTPIVPISDRDVNLRPSYSSSDLKSRSKTLPILLVVLGVVVVGIGGFFAWQYFSPSEESEIIPRIPILRKPTIQPTAIPTIDPTANWQTYTNDQYQFSLKYPPETLKIATGSAKNLADFDYMTPVTSITSNAPIAIKKIDLKPTDNFQDVLLKNVTFDGSGKNPAAFTEFKPVQLGENTFYYIEKGRFEGLLTLSYFLPQKDYILQFDLNSDIGPDWTNPNFDVANEKLHLILKQMLSTLKITTASQTTGTENWEMYTNAIYKYSIKYPNTLYIRGVGFSGKPEDYPDGIIILPLNKILSDDIVPHMHIYNLNKYGYEGDNIEQVASKNYNENKSKSDSFNIVQDNIAKPFQSKFLGYDSYEFYLKSKGFVTPGEQYIGYEGIYKVIVFKKNDDLFMIQYTKDSEFDQILSTFKFTE